MIADIIADFDHHLEHSNVWLVELQLPLQDAPDDAPDFIDVDVYVVAQTQNQAVYIAQCMYPDILGSACSDRPVTPEEYATRRNRSLL